MTARVLVVDDLPVNVKLLEAKLLAEYFDVITATSGAEALAKIETDSPDIVLLDVMMPGMDGFEVCERIKRNPISQHIPVVMVTALDQPSDRVKGIEAGADDFLTKPLNDIALFARVRSLVRLKMMTDELRMRDRTGQKLGIIEEDEIVADLEKPRNILIVEDRKRLAIKMEEQLSKPHRITIATETQQAVDLAWENDYDLIIVSLVLRESDGLRICSSLRSNDLTRHTPILVLVEAGNLEPLVKALNIGVNDYLLRPIDTNELEARVRTQMKRKAYEDRLRVNYHKSLEMAVTDPLTGLYNRRYMNQHLETHVLAATNADKPCSLLIVDIDHFKRVNDTYGHDIGDDVLKKLAAHISLNTRGVDMACRFGGEEFVIIMPDTTSDVAVTVAERLRAAVADNPVGIRGQDAHLSLTISVGVATTSGGVDTSESLMKKADSALYQAKESGRNKVVIGD